MTDNANAAVVLLSGGLDSTVLLHHIVRDLHAGPDGLQPEFQAAGRRAVGFHRIHARAAVQQQDGGQQEPGAHQSPR